MVSFHHLIRQIAPGVMKVNGLDVNIGVEGVLVVENRASSVMSHVEAIREKLLVNIFGRLLQINEMPPSCNLFFESIFFSPSGSRVPVVDAEHLSRTTDRVAKCLLALFM